MEFYSVFCMHSHRQQVGPKKNGVGIVLKFHLPLTLILLEWRIVE